jgi:phosphotransferase system enzyme I (PtsI)
MERFKGMGASPGVAVGAAYVIDRRSVRTPKRHLDGAEIGAEVERFRAALRDADADLDRIKRKLAGRPGGEAPIGILEAHQMIVHDEHLADATERAIRDQGINAEWALAQTVAQVKRLFDQIEDEYFRERRSDVDFVAERIMRKLCGDDAPPPDPPPGAVVVAHDLSPADMAQLSRQEVAGIATDEEITRRLDELFVDDSLREEQRRGADELDRAGTAWTDEQW